MSMAEVGASGRMSGHTGLHSYGGVIAKSHGCPGPHCSSKRSFFLPELSLQLLPYCRGGLCMTGSGARDLHWPHTSCDGL